MYRGFWLLLWLGIAASAGAQVQEITGQVMNQGEPVRGLSLTLANTNGQPLANTVTDRRGQFRLAGVPSGIYTLDGRMGDYVINQPVTIPANTVDSTYSLGTLNWQHAPAHLPGLPLPPERHSRRARRNG